MSGMRALGVIKADPVANHPLGNEAVGQLVQVDRLIFGRGNEKVWREMLICP
jgi:hypothetical protein